MARRATEEELVQSLLQILGEDRHRCIFVDDGGAGHHDMGESVLVQDHRTYTAVVIAPGNLEGLHRTYSRCFDVARQHAAAFKEFHGTEMINPKKGSPWYGVDTAVRAKLWANTVEAMFPFVDRVVHGQIGREQYERELAKYGPAIQKLPSHVQESLRKHEWGLEHVFHVALTKMVLRDRIPTIILQDNGRYTERFKQQFLDDVPIWQGGVIYWPSESCPGIQLADLLSVAIARHFCTRARKLAGKSENLFDKAAVAIGSMMSGKLVDMLDISPQRA